MLTYIMLALFPPLATTNVSIATNEWHFLFWQFYVKKTPKLYLVDIKDHVEVEFSLNNFQVRFSILVYSGGAKASCCFMETSS